MLILKIFSIIFQYVDYIFSAFDSDEWSEIFHGLLNELYPKRRTIKFCFVCMCLCAVQNMLGHTVNLFLLDHRLVGILFLLNKLNLFKALVHCTLTFCSKTKILKLNLLQKVSFENGSPLDIALDSIQAKIV